MHAGSIITNLMSTRKWGGVDGKIHGKMITIFVIGLQHRSSSFLCFVTEMSYVFYNSKSDCLIFGNYCTKLW